MDGLVVDGLEVHTGCLAAKGHAQTVDYEATAMGNRDATADTGGPEIFTPLEHLKQHALGFLIELEQPNEFFENFVLARTLKLELDSVFGEELAQFHSRVS